MCLLLSDWLEVSRGHQTMPPLLPGINTGTLGCGTVGLEGKVGLCFVFLPPLPLSHSPPGLQPGVQGGVGLSDCLLIAPGSSLGSPLSSSAQDQGWRCCRLLHLPRPQPGTENCWKDGFPRYPTAVCLTSSLSLQHSPSKSPVSCADFTPANFN